MNRIQILLSYFLLCTFVTLVASHAALTFPPARQMIGTVGWGDCDTLYCKKNYNPTGLNLGPHSGEWGDDTNICGSPDYIQPLPKPVATYNAGGDIDITISIGAAHQGYYEFRLCVPDQVNQMPPSTNSEVRRCVQAGPLLRRKVPLADGQMATTQGKYTYSWTQLQRETRWRQEPEDGVRVDPVESFPSYKLTYVLPSNVQCEHCILHWYWQALNNWQTGTADSIATTEGERFWNCADIAIKNPSAQSSGITSGIVGGSSNPNPAPRPNPNPAPRPPTNPPSNPNPAPRPNPNPAPRPPTNPPSNPNPAPRPNPNPVPRPPSNPNPVPRPGGSGGCSGVKYGSQVSEWWAAVIAPGASSMSIKCSDGSTRSCNYDAGWGRFVCIFQTKCTPRHEAVIGGSSCPLSGTSAATDSDGLEETSENGNEDVEDAEDNEEVNENVNENDEENVGDSIPGWAIGLFVVGSISIFTLFVILFIVLRSDKVESV